MTKYKRYLAGIISAMMVISDLGSGGLMSVYAAEDESVVVDAGDAAGDEESAVVADETEGDSQQADGGEAVASDADSAADEASKDAEETEADQKSDESQVAGEAPESGFEVSAGDDSEMEAVEEAESLEVSGVEDVSDEEADVNGEIKDGFYVAGTMIEGVVDSTAQTIKIPSWATSIKAEAFKADNNDEATLVTVDFSEATELDTINAKAFYGQKNIRSLDFSNCTKLNYIYESAFQNCEAAQTLVFNDRLTLIGANAFNGCKKVDSITLPAMLTSIGANAFAGCKSVEDITVNTNLLTNMTDTTYFNTTPSETETLLKTITFGPGVTSVPAHLFKNIAFAFKSKEENATGGTVILGEEIIAVEAGAFEGAQNLQFLDAGSSNLATIGDKAFMNNFCTRATDDSVKSGYNRIGLKEANLPATVTSIGASAFEKCNEMDDIVPLGDSSRLTSIGDRAFFDCEWLEVAHIPATVTNENLGAAAFCSCYSLEDVTIPSTYTFLPNNVFNGCSIAGYNEAGHFNNITNIGEYALGRNFIYSETVNLSNVEICGKGAFKECGMGKVNIGSKLGYLPEEMFLKCPVLTQIDIPANIKDSKAANSGIDAIGKSAFQACDSLATVNFAALTNATLTIGNSAFADCEYLSTVKYAQGLVEIGESAFSNCIRYSTEKSAEFPSTLTTIGKKAFYDCGTELKIVTIPENVATIGESAFEKCEGVNTVNVNSTVETCGKNIFKGCNIEALNFEPTITAIPNNMFYAAGYLSGTVEIEIPATVTTIGDYAFAGSGTADGNVVYNKVKFLDGSQVTRIGDYAFSNASNMVFINFPDTLVNIGNYAFYKDAALGQGGMNVDLPAGLREIGAYAFAGCTSINHMFIPSTVEIKDFGLYCFGNPSDAQNKGVPASAFRTGADTPAYEYLTTVGLTSDDITDGVATITYHFDETAENNVANSTCFEPAAGHRVMNIKPASMAGYSFIGWYDNSSFTGNPVTSTKNRNGNFDLYAKFNQQSCDEAMFQWSNDSNGNPTVISKLNPEYSTINPDWDGTWIIIPAKCTSIKYNAFKDNTKLASVAFENGCAITAIGESAFEGCIGITRVDLTNAKNLISIDKKAFYGCTGINKLIFNDALATIGEQAFMKCNKITEIELTKNLAQFGKEVFRDCTLLSKVVICSAGLSVASTNSQDGDIVYNSLCPGTFFNCAIKNVTMGTANGGTTCDVIPAGLFYMATFASDTEFVMPKSIRTVGIGAFAATYNLKSVDFSQVEVDEVTIKNFAFEYDPDLETVNLGNKVVSIGEKAFDTCNKLTSMEIPASVTQMGKGVFSNCALLEEVDIKSSAITEIPESAFEKDVKLTTVTLPVQNNVLSIDKLAFGGCTSLERFDAADYPKLMIIGESAFKGDSKLEQVLFIEGLTEIRESAFENCILLEDLELPASLTLIGKTAFKGNTMLGTVTLSTGSRLETIGESAFVSDAGLTRFATASGKLTSLVTIGASAFSKCSNMSRASFDGATALETIGNQAFEECTMLELDISDDVALKTIGSKAFYKCVNVTKADFTNMATLTAIGESAFEGCREITDVVIPATVTDLGGNAFKDCQELEYITLSAVALKDGNASKPVFENCRGLINFTISDGVTKIPSYMLYKSNFGGAPGVIRIPASVESIGDYAISGYEIKTGSGDSAKVDQDFLKVEKVIFSEGSKLKKIGKYAFSYILNMTSFTMPDSVETVDEYALSCDSALEEATLSSSLKAIPNFLFYNDSALKSVDNNGCQPTTLGASAFAMCSSLRSYSIPSSVTSVGSSAFASCENLTIVYIPDSVRTLTDKGEFGVFTGDVSLKIAASLDSEGYKYAIAHNIPVITDGIYLITYELNGGTNINTAPKTYYVNDPQGLTLPTPTYAGHAFAGWYLDEALTKALPNNNTKGQTGELKVYAKWDVDWSNVKYTVNFDPGNSKAVKPEPIEVIGDAEFTLPTVELGGYTFEGWYFDKKDIEEGKAPNFKGGETASKLMDHSGNITLYGKLLGAEYNITYMIADSNGSNDGENPKTYNVSEKDVTIKPADSSTKGAKFEGWYAYRTDIQQYAKMDKIPANCYGDLVLYAFFSYDKNSYNVKFDLDGGKMNGSLPSNIKASKKQHFYIPVYNAAVKDGYTFKGWGKSKKKATYSYETEYFREIKSSIAAKADDEDTSSSSDVTLYAVWGAYEFNVDGSMYGKSLDTVSSDGLWYFPEDETDATKGGGFYTAKQLKTIRKSKMTHTADKKLKLLKPKKPGYTFSMWSIRNAEDGKEITTDKSGIPKGSECAKDIYVVPIWTENVFFITFDGNGGMVDGSKKLKDLTEYKYTTSVNMVSANRVTTIPGKTDGRKLAGWSFNKKDTTPMFKPGQVVNKVTLYDPKKDKASGYGKMSFKKKAKIKIYAIWQ